MRRALPRWSRVSFGKLPRRTFGLSEWVTREVVIDLRKEANPVKTYLHELLHITFPLVREAEIERETNRIWREMSDRERFALGRRLFMRPYRSSDEE
jgi:hypothetical protein